MSQEQYKGDEGGRQILHGNRNIANFGVTMGFKLVVVKFKFVKLKLKLKSLTKLKVGWLENYKHDFLTTWNS